jgi:hypothetical protein
MFPRRAKALMTAAVAVLAAAALPGIAQAADCTSSLSYDPNVPTWDQFFSDPANAGSGAIQPFASGGPGRSTGKNTTANLDAYFDGVMAAVNTAPGTRDRVEIVKKPLGRSELGTYDAVPGRDLAFWVIGTKANIDKLDGPGGDAEFWAGVRSGAVSEADGLAGIQSRPAFGWVTATPHGNEPAAGEAIARELYELAARLDCENLNRLQNMDTFLMPVRNPDGRDNNVRTTAWAFDPNRDFGTHNQIENDIFIPEMNKYPGVFFIDAHQQTTGYFFPPNEDPVHHEISDFSLDFIQKKIGPTLQSVFNDQSSQYQNYNSYDLFTPEYGDTVPSLLMGAAGMTYEKGTDESYSKQVYDHYLAIDTTINLTAQSKNTILSGWVRQWQQAVDQGALCQLQKNKLVSPLHDTINQLVPQGGDDAVCGYFYKPGQHTGDVAALLKNLTEVGVHVEKFTSDVTIDGVREFGKHGTTETLPAGTLYIPMAQPMKHWIQAVLGQDPFIPYNYYYDVVDWSYSTQRGLAGDGWLTVNPPASATATMAPVTSIDLGSAPSGAPDVYAFNTDSMQGLALAAELLDKGVTVYRGETAFDEDGHHYATGAALVDGASLRATAGVDLGAMAHARQTDVYGLDRYPVAHKALAKPKIGLYTGAATIPTNPINVSGANVNGTTGQCTSTTFCAAYFTLVRKDGLPASMVQPVTTTDLQSGVLASGGFTALINPTATIAASDTVSLAAISAFVNAGGIYVGNLTGGLATARNAGLTTLNTAPISGLNTPGTTFDATFDTTDPVAWGFDAGGWVYRDTSSNPTYDAATLPAGATAVVRYAGDPAGYGGLHAYGYQVNALNTDAATGRLDGRPAVVDQPLGAGHAVLLGFDPFFRAWKEQDERLVLNAVMYPLGASQPATTAAAKARAPTPATAQQQVAPVADPLARAKLPKVASRPAAKGADIDRDVRITIRKRDLRTLRKAVKAARLPSSARRRVVFVHRGSTLVFVVKGVRPTGTDHHPLWIGRVMHQLTQRHVSPLAAQL